jgi:hypothetical protein
VVKEPGVQDCNAKNTSAWTKQIIVDGVTHAKVIHSKSVLFI